MIMGLDPADIATLKNLGIYMLLLTGATFVLVLVSMIIA